MSVRGLVKLRQTPQHDLTSSHNTAAPSFPVVPTQSTCTALSLCVMTTNVPPLAPTRLTCTVLSLCAMTTTVRPLTSRCTACCTSFSLTESSALVASSRMMMGESLSSARAIAMRCRCPPAWGGRVQNVKQLV